MTDRKENTKGLLASAVKELSLADAEKTLEFGSSYINIRPTGPQVGMLEAIRRINGKNPTAIMQDDISEALAMFLRSSEDFMPIIAKAVAAVENGAFGNIDGALGILEKEGVFKSCDLTFMRPLLDRRREKTNDK